MVAAIDAIKTSSLFKGFTETGLQIFGAIATARVFPRGTPLFVEGMVGDSLFIVALGQVRLTAKNTVGEDVNIGEIGPGEHIGEMALLSQGPRLCTAVAMSDVTALEFRSVDFQRLLAQKPQACLKLVLVIAGAMAQKVRDLQPALKPLVGKS